MNAQKIVTPDRFAQGLTIEQFVNQMTKNRDIFEEHYRTFTLNEEDAAFFSRFPRPLNVLVLAEDWCGDVLRYLPALARIADVARTWNVRVFHRDRNLDLADMWMREGKYRAIPVVVFFDEQMRELAHFIEKPQEVYEAEAQAHRMFARLHPDLPDAEAPVAEMTESTRALYIPYIREFRQANRLQWQQLFVEKIRGLLAGCVQGVAT